MTLIVNLFGAPGAGKSTTRAGVFHKLKLAGVNIEECPEYAKDLSWEKRYSTLLCQPYVFGKQLRNMSRLMEQVDVIVTDSPLLLSSHYAGWDWPQSFHDFVYETFEDMGGLNYYLNRVKPYSSAGRSQTEEESDMIGRQIRDLLAYRKIEYTTIDGDLLAADRIAGQVIMTLDEMRELGP
jgi:hypothetical protein